ncbi:cell wall-binding repeat-containing protein [Peptacetobacter hominis]|nr:cell wall-binding repeat-containing protein [Peptacetobacter hominis]
MKKLNSCLMSTVMVASSLGVVCADSTKIVGEDRFDTAAKIADQLGSYDTAVLVNGYSTSDGLSASSFAEYKKAPILLTKENKIPDTTMKRLQKVKKVYIIGGTAVVSSGIQKQLENMGKSVIRLQGKNRMSTSLEVANAIGSYDKAFIVNGFTGDADAMSVAPVAARDKAPIIVTNGKTAPSLRKSGVDYYAIGGTSAISDDLAHYYRATRVAGANRYETNEKVLDKFYSNANKVYYANGKTLVDALAVSTLASDYGVALVSKGSDKSYLEGKDLVQVGGMDFTVNPSPSEDTDRPGIDSPDDDKFGNGMIPDKRPLTITVGKQTVTVKQGAEVKVSDFQITAKNFLGEQVSASSMSFENFPGTNTPGTYKVKVKIWDKSRNCYDYTEVTLKVESVITEKTYDVYSMEFQNIVREEFYKYLDAHRKANGVPAAEHRWEVEESTLLKSKYMMEKGEISHDFVQAPHFMGGAEAVASRQLYNPLTEDAGKELGKALFEQWKKSPAHNDILLSDYTNYWGTKHTIDGFSFWVNPDGNSYRVYATYQIAQSDTIK